MGFQGSDSGVDQPFVAVSYDRSLSRLVVVAVTNDRSPVGLHLRAPRESVDRWPMVIIIL